MFFFQGFFAELGKIIDYSGKINDFSGKKYQTERKNLRFDVTFFKDGDNDQVWEEHRQQQGYRPTKVTFNTG